jgi:hypothetical protein
MVECYARPNHQDAQRRPGSTDRRSWLVREAALQRPDAQDKRAFAHSLAVAFPTCQSNNISVNVHIHVLLIEVVKVTPGVRQAWSSLVLA